MFGALVDPKDGVLRECVRSPTVREGNTREHSRFKKIGGELLC